MLAFLLGLLKIIGIVLLVILLVLLLLIAVVLLVPIKYQAEGTMDEEKKQAKAMVTWLCKLVRMKLDYNFPDKPLISFKILWFELLKEKKPKKPKKVKEPKEPKTVKEKKTKQEKQKKEKYHPAVNNALLETADAEAAVKEEKDVVVQNEKTNEETNKENGESVETSESGNKIEKIIFKIQGLYDKINKIIENINYYLDILEEDETQGLIKEAWKSILKILNSIKPKVFRMNAIVGFDMPDTTGRVYGYYCMLMPWLNDDIYIEPDFEQKIINGEIYCKGKIRILTIVVNILRIVFDKRLKPLLKKIKNGGK